MSLRHTGRVAARAARRSARQAGVALVYHYVGDPPGNPQFELVPALDTRLLQAQLDYLRMTYRVVPASRLLEAALERRPGDRFPVAITFDDDLSSHVDVAAPALQRARLPATFYLCGASLDGADAFWWEDLQTLSRHPSNALPRLASLSEVDLGSVRCVPRALHEVAEVIERLPPDRRDAVAAELRSHVGERRSGLSRVDIASLHRAGFEIGFHTRRHYLLETVDDASLSHAMIEGRDRLEAVAGRPLSMIAYPHGKADDRIADAARVAGYEFGFTAAPTSVGPTTDPLLIGRMEVQPGSLRNFHHAVVATLRRAAGWSGRHP